MLLSIDETHTSTGSYGNDFEFSKKQFIFVVWETIFLTLFLVMYKWSQDYSRYMWKIHPMKQLLTPRKMLEGLFQKASIFIILINDMFSFCFFFLWPTLKLKLQVYVFPIDASLPDVELNGNGSILKAKYWIQISLSRMKTKTYMLKELHLIL